MVRGWRKPPLLSVTCAYPQPHLLLSEKGTYSHYRAGGIHHLLFFLKTALASVQAPNLFLSFWFVLFGETRSCYIIVYDLELLAAPPKAHTTHRCEPPGQPTSDLESKEMLGLGYLWGSFTGSAERKGKQEGEGKIAEGTNPRHCDPRSSIINPRVAPLKPTRL